MYYKLTCRAAANRRDVGDTLLCGQRPLHIGQTVSCDLRLPEADDAEAQVYAVILPHEAGNAWTLVRRTDCYEVAVNGQPVPIARQLQSGDLLTFADGKRSTSYLFEVENDGDYDARSGIVHRRGRSHRLMAVATMVLGLAAVGIAVFALFFKDKVNVPMQHRDLAAYEQSIFKITTDSVYLVCDSLVDGVVQEVVLDSAALEWAESGTCFLTDSGLFVTARHCVEPWITDEEWDGQRLTAQMPAAVRMAVWAETQNRLEMNERYRVKAHCYVSASTMRYDFFSTDFHTNKTRDQVLCLGTRQHPYYQRTILPLASRRNMELGDFAYVEAPDSMRGTISLATIEDLHTFENQVDKEIAVLGFPMSDNASEIISKIYGNSQYISFADDGKSMQGCIAMSAPVNKGNSGGPVLAFIGDSVKVVGIVSKVDSKATQGTFWAVPSTEVLQLHEQGGAIQPDTQMFRR